MNWSGVAPSTTAFDGRTASKCSETSKIDPKKQYRVTVASRPAGWADGRLLTVEMYLAVGSKRPRSLADADNATGRVHAQVVSSGRYNTLSLAICEGAGKGTSVKT